MKKTLLLIATFILIFLLPYLGSYAQWGGMPPGYGLFPAEKAVDDPGFSPLYFTFGVLVALLIVAFLVFPKWFGFKSSPQEAITAGSRRTDAVSFPWWFRAALPMLFICWFIMWAPLPLLTPLEPFTFVPLWWSFILVLDGLVYRRTGGNSLIAKKPALMQLLAVVSCFSWFAFEYLNFFVLENWYYPNNEVFSDFGNIMWFSLSYTTVLPAIIEWYLLLRTIPFFRNRYSSGPSIRLSRKVLIAFYGFGVVLAFGMGYYPFLLFWVLWVALVPLLSAAMGLAGYWTPFSPIKQGNWTPLLLIAIATLFNGFFWELWNFGSEWFRQGAPVNPNYWKYSVPYLDKFHFFSEMPILGYFGYLVFGVNCWILWLTAAYIFKFDANFDLSQTGHPDHEKGT